MKRVVLGAGGHGKVVCDVLLRAGLAVDGFVDDRLAAGTRVLDRPVLGNTEWLVAHPCEVALGIGDNERRRRLADQLGGCTLLVAVHPHASVAPSAVLEPGVVVMARAVVNPDARIGRGAIVNSAAVVEHDCRIGAFVHLSPAAALGGAAAVDDEAHVGLGAVVLPSIRVGARSIVGAGAVVNRDVPPDVVVRGVPGRIARKRS